MSALEKFLKYVTYETTATEARDDNCSNPLIWKLTSELLRELEKLNPDRICVNRYGIIDCLFKGKSEKEPVAFLAHMDTAPACSGRDVKPQIVHYEGQDVVLKNGLVLSRDEFPTLDFSLGHDIVVTDGNTLLGGDDKAGISIIMASLERVLENTEHRTIEVIFTTDEEIGADAEHVSVEDLVASYGYTIDGGDYRYVSIETFSAMSMEVEILGKSIHPGSAKDKLVNANEVLFKFHSSLPAFLKPEHTDKREPFYHLCSVVSCEDKANASYIIRSFEDEQVLDLKELAQLAKERINAELGYEAVNISFNWQYHNMLSILKERSEIQEEFEAVYKKNNVECLYEAVRGGTTGSQLSFKGLPCPNLGTGDYNMHGRYEYVDVEQMEKMVDIVSDLMIG